MHMVRVPLAPYDGCERIESSAERVMVASLRRRSHASHGTDRSCRPAHAKTDVKLMLPPLLCSFQSYHKSLHSGSLQPSSSEPMLASSSPSRCMRSSASFLGNRRRALMNQLLTYATLSTITEPGSGEYTHVHLLELWCILSVARTPASALPLDMGCLYY